MTADIQPPVYNPAQPIASDVPRDNQGEFRNNFWMLNYCFNTDHVPLSGLFTAISNSNPTLVTSPLHTLATGNQVSFQGLNDDPTLGIVTGMGGLMAGNPFTITVVDANNFTLNGSDSTAFVPYDVTSYQGSYSSASLLSGQHKKISYDGPTPNPNLSADRSSLYSKTYSEITQLAFQNDKPASSIAQLTGVEIVTTQAGHGFISPWGLIFNMGEIQFPGASPATYNFPIPYTGLGNIFCIEATAFIQTVSKNVQVHLAADAISQTQFTAQGIKTGSASAVNAYYFAVGF